jgi:P pilus assembly chaperone PapD
MQIANLFSAQSKVTTVNATTTASAAVQLSNSGNTLRVVNEGPNAAFICVADTAALAVATLPTNGVTTSCYVASGADVTFSIPNDSNKFVSAICRTGTAVIEFYAGESS